MRISGLLVLLVTTALSAACDVAATGRCKPPPIEKVYEQATTLVVAKVKKLEPTSNGEVNVTLCVSQAWKGDVPAEVTFRTGPVYTYNPPVGEEHFFALYAEKDGQYTTDSCAGSKPINLAKPSIEWLRQNGRLAQVR